MRVSLQTVVDQLLRTGRYRFPDGTEASVPSGTPATRARLVAARAVAEWRARELARALESPARSRAGDWQSVRAIAELIARHWQSGETTTPFFRIVIGPETVVVEKASGSTPLATVSRSRS